jgi:tripartite ATP-independent transporter DctM subunit
MARVWPSYVGENISTEELPAMPRAEMFQKTWPVASLILLVLGGIYTGWLTPVEAGAAGASLALIVALARRSISWPDFWSTLVETGHITAAILLLITMASFYSRMLGYAGLPNQLDALLQAWDMSFFQIMLIYVALMLVLGTLLYTASIILIVVPLFITLMESMGLSLVWFGIITVIGAEIGLLTPPLGISCFVIKSTLNDPDISLKDVFLGSFPFAVLMLLVLILLIQYPILSTALI